ncbi:MAG: three-Cys-motif partner protein TcmP [Acidiphilium sp.]|nr:three-Cys-motif partner protein TcmP [Acidiphilium sp.]
MSDVLTAASWDLEPHTAAKLAILGAYLRAWFPILSRSQNFDRMIYIDGFAGPGRYKQGEDGSPIIALKAALGAANGPIPKTFEFHFVERKRRPAISLKANIEHLRQNRVIPTNFEIHVHAGLKFEIAYEQYIRPRLQANTPAPAFALVDPFGWTGIPMSILAELTTRPSTEILVNFMFEEINRFLIHPEQGSNFDGLFGCHEWSQGYDMTGAARKKFIHDLYRDQLHKLAGAKYVRSFEMRNQRNATDYFLYFASNNRLGLTKMKEAMWKVDPGGGFMFSDATNIDQAVLFEPVPDRRALRRLIAERFSGRRATVQQVENFVVEHTPFHSGHYLKVLAAMETENDLTHLRPAPGRRKATFADKSAVLEFR